MRQRLATILFGVLPMASLAAQEITTVVPPSDARRGRTVLSKVALGMQPGSWAEVPVEIPEHLMRVATGRTESGKIRRYHIAGWTDDGHWDSRTGWFYYMGFRKQLKFIAYTEVENQWRTLPGPFGWNSHVGEPGQGTFRDPRRNHYGHVYGKNGFDAKGGAYYHKIGGHTYRYDIASGAWTRFGDRGPGMSIEFFPGLGLITHDAVKGRSDVGQLSVLDEDSDTWRPFAEVPFTPYHALARYHPELDEMLLIAGNDRETVVALDRQGRVTRLPDVPVPVTIRHGKLVVDPASGHYLLFQHDELYVMDRAEMVFRLVSGYSAPFGKYEMPVPAAIPEYGVIMFIDQKLRLYRHNAK